MPDKVLNILSLGAGVQSKTVLLRYMDQLDYAIFADTGWEPQAVYDNLERLKERFPIITVSVGDIRKEIMSGDRFASMPFFVSNGGTARRQCTKEYKIEPIERKIRELIGLRKGQRWPKELKVRQWFGISYDEIQRMRVSLRPAVEFYYPLIEERWTRGHCLEWLKEHWPYPPARSACVGCPYRSNKEWLMLTDNEFKQAIEFDRAIRVSGLRGKKFRSYLHRSLKPLDEVDLSDPAENQLSLLDECEGMCGV